MPNEVFDEFICQWIEAQPNAQEGGNHVQEASEVLPAGQGYPLAVVL